MTDVTDARTIAYTILRRLGEIPGYRAGRLRIEPTSPTLAELEPLARAYLAMVGGRGADLLGHRGPLWVGPEAAEAFAAQACIYATGTAHAELTVRLYTATPAADGGWRSRHAGWDVSARVTSQATAAGPMLVVTHASSRRYR